MNEVEFTKEFLDMKRGREKPISDFYLKLESKVLAGEGSKLEQTRLYRKDFRTMNFCPEIDRLRTAGATDDMIIETFSEITNPLNPHRAREIKLGGKEHTQRNYDMCIEYLTNPDRPSLKSVAQKYDLTRERSRQIIERFRTEIGICDQETREKFERINGKTNEQINRYLSRLKKALYDRIIDKIIDSVKPDDKIEDLK